MAFELSDRSVDRHPPRFASLLRGLLDALAGLGTTAAHRHLVEVAEVVQLLLVVIAAADELNNSLLAVDVEGRRQGFVEHVAKPMKDHV